MFKKTFFSLSLATLLYSSDLPYTIYASKVVSDGDVVFADGDVVIYNGANVYKADSAVYNRDKKSLKLYGNVTSITGDTRTQSENLDIKTDTKAVKTDRFFTYDAKEGLWLRGSSYRGKDGIYITKDSEISSCNIVNPDWKILFSKAKFDKKNEFLYLYRPTFYLKKVPVFALPWFAFPTIKERKTGLLRPEFGVQAGSGFVFMQPYFYAPAKNWDIEFDPQIRTTRGYGLYSTLNFVDSAYSSGKVTVGKFIDKESFFEKEDLKNKTHYGLDISYESDKVFKRFLKKDSYKDGLWIDYHYLNDVDYENLKGIKIKSLNKLVVSRFNYFLKRDKDYFGVYSKYFLDTSKESNSDTMQELPSLQYHRFTTNLPVKNLIYSIDYKVKNNYREKGLNAAWHEINLPVKLDIPLFNNFLNFSISENLYYSEVKYRNKDGLNIENAKYFSNYHKFTLSSDLTKEYGSFIHNLQLESSLQVPSFENKSGDFADFININKEEKNLKLGINQYFYDKQGFDFLTLRSSQTIYIDRDENKQGDIYNEIIYQYSKKLSISENIDFSSKYNKIKKIQTNINYHDDFYSFNISHTHQNVPNLTKINYLTSDFKINLSNGYKIDGLLNYDVDKKLTRDWGIGLYRDKRCWNYKIDYKESVIPILTSGGARSYKNRGLYFLVNFANIGGISYEYSKDDIVDDLGSGR